MKVDKVQYVPSCKGEFISNREIALAMDKADYLTSCVHDVFLERMKNSADGYKFELVSKGLGLMKDLKSDGKGLYRNFVLRIFNKGKVKERPLYNSGKETEFTGRTEGECYSGVLKQVNKVLKSFYPKKVKNVSEEEIMPAASERRFLNVINDSDILQEEAVENVEHNDLEQFDNFFRDGELFDKNNDWLTGDYALYGEDDVELGDDLKAQFMDAFC